MQHRSPMLRCVFAALIPAMFALAPFGIAHGQDSEIADGKPPEAPAAKDKKPEKPEPKRFPEFKEVTKDMKAEDGLFTLYRYDPSDKERDPEKLLCKIPAKLLGEDLLFATSLSAGGPLTGYMWQSDLIRFEIAGEQLKIVTPDTRYVSKEGEPVSDVIERTYNDRYIANVPIVSMDGGDPVFDLGALLKSDLADVSFLGGAVRSDLSEWNKVKVFPDNILIDVDLALGGKQGGRMVGVAYAFRRLPKLGSYSPREADDRIGYFLTTHMDWTRKHEARDTYDRFVNRWELEKRDPSLELSPPKRPITFIIEKTVPVRWRRWVAEGILEWNKAFEEIGYVNAIVVQQQTDDNEFAGYDPEDARYNFFRWIVSGRAFAMGPSRVDPRTGQILDADIIMDDSFVRAYMEDFNLMAPAATAALKGPAMKFWRERYPNFAEEVFPQFLSEPTDDTQRLIDLAHDKLHANGQSVCTYADGFQQQLALVHNAIVATATGKKIPERFIGEAVREVVTHEVGHTLGLRHNFKGSNWLSLEEIKRRRDNTDEPTCASVMDYNPLLFFSGDTPEKMGHFITTAIGPYDHWAIEYGYASPEKGKDEKEMLKAIAARCAEPGLDYATDEDTVGSFSPDPTSNRFDMSDDPLAWAQDRIKLVDSLLPTILDWSVADGESRYYARNAFRTLWFQKATNFEYIARLVGGQYFHRDHKGDPDARPAFVLVDADKQRAALKAIGDSLFNDDFFECNAELLNQLPPSRWDGFGGGRTVTLDFPIHDWIGMLQQWTLIDLMSPMVLQRIYDAELKSTAKNKFTAAEYIKALRDSIWTELSGSPQKTSDADPYISSIKRNLQRDYLDVMLAYARTSPGGIMSPDLSSMVRQALRELSARIGEASESGGLDFASKAHLVDCKSRIDRVLDAQFTDR